jgi:hypothetical protein
MFDDGALDLFALSRDVERALARPADVPRHLSSQKTYRALREREPAAHDVLLRDALLRFVHEFLQTRVAADLSEDEARAVAAPADGADADAPRTFDEARIALVTAPHRKAAVEAFDRFVERAPAVGAARAEKRLRRFEVARRLGLAHPFALANEVSPGAARALLDASEPLASDLAKRERREVEGVFRPIDAIRVSLATTAREGWPAILGARWLREVFPALSMPVRPPRFSEPVGGASFLRAAAKWGVALREGGTARSLPFALSHDPYPTSAHAFGAALALALADPVLQRRRLGLSARTADAQSRALRRSLFFALRLQAMRFVLAAQERVAAGDFEELGVRVFGAPLPDPLRDAWPAARPDESARFAALLSAPGFVRGLVARHDEDWFENPRAGAELAQIASGPVFDAAAPEEKAPQEMARFFEEALA